MISRSSVLSLIVLVFLGVAFAPRSFAGGSIGWSQVNAEVSKGDPFLAMFIAEHLEVNRVGGAVRVGHQANGDSAVPGVEIGTRMPPYEFLAKPKRAKGDFTLLITLRPISFDNYKTQVWEVSIRKKRATD